MMQAQSDQEEAVYHDISLDHHRHHDTYSYSDSYSFHQVYEKMATSSTLLEEEEDTKKEQAYPLLSVQYAQLQQRLAQCAIHVIADTKQHPARISTLLLTFTLLICWSGSPLGNYYNPHDAGMLMQNHRNVRHAMTSSKYSHLEVAYNFKMDDLPVDHWCLFGGSEQEEDDDCPCEDPTHGQDRHEYPAWTQARDKNVAKLANATSSSADIVFVGDETVQSWDGMWFNQRCPQSKEIVGHWNRTFGDGRSEEHMKGMTLGISGDRITHVLWRLQHGEMPTEVLNAKVIWLVLGSRDLAVRLCSEEVVTLGILRVAEEIKHYNPQATVVIQSILPRTHHKDGSLESAADRPLKHQNLVFQETDTYHQNRLATEFGEVDEGLEALEEDEERQMHNAEPKYDYYLWPSIQNINTEVQRWTETHDGFEFFDATPLFLGSYPNDRNHKFIQRELLREYAQLSHIGHGILLDAIHTRAKQLLRL